MNLTAIDWIIMLVYFVFVLGIGFLLKRKVKTSTDLFSWQAVQFPPGYVDWHLFRPIWALRK